jgi:hypothetical protein
MHPMTQRKVDPIEVVRAVEAEIGVQILPREKRRRQTSAHGLARRIAAWIMRQHLGLSNCEIEHRLGLTHPAGKRYPERHDYEMYMYPHVREITDNVLSRLGVKCNHGVELVDRISIEGDAVIQIQPRTPIAEALLRARRAYLEAGGKLLGWDELDEELRQLRGGLEEK